jgi:hypothetical protein
MSEDDMNFDRLMLDLVMMRLPDDPPPDPEACLECQYHPTNLNYGDGGHCYMFKELPDTLCMQFKGIKIARNQ